MHRLTKPLAYLFLCQMATSLPLLAFDRAMNEEFDELSRWSSGNHPLEMLSTVAAINRQLEPTPTQPLGPFYPLKKPLDVDVDLTTINGGPSASGLFIFVQGQIKDLDGHDIANAGIEIWQACASGKYNHIRDSNPAPIDPNFQYYASTTSDASGSFMFKTILPGAYPASDDWWRPPHIHFSISAPGYKPLITQLYFDDASFPGSNIGEYNANDRILSRLDPSQRAKLIISFYASEELNGDKLGVFNIYLEKIERKRD